MLGPRDWRAQFNCLLSRLFARGMRTSYECPVHFGCVPAGGNSEPYGFSFFDVAERQFLRRIIAHVCCTPVPAERIWTFGINRSRKTIDEARFTSTFVERQPREISEHGGYYITTTRVVNNQRCIVEI